MKKYYIIYLFFILSNLFAQNKKYDTIIFRNIKIDKHELYFKYENFENLERLYGKLKKNSKPEKIPLNIGLKVTNSFSNDGVSLLIDKNKVFIDYLNFELSKKVVIINYKKRNIILSNDFRLSQFKKVFKKSYKNVSGLPVIPFERAAFISALIINKKKIAYVSFTFYDGKLISFFISDDKPENF
ncbi:hypothetical protein BC749_1042 [Flavobacterium araucananum]|uniref:Uncharacterized protein n=1 Tax=Flavobacterium araucananum TaxID=946678 RepID=A0A227NKP2_9FLAO|nr:hypothetical protein [Flavobacterium araucananum]OXE97408.1 hypothetical protein B0A64_23360 [Flavobacterium araucananum]PWJ98862.1 hypothetical protein BC749_1042 [Flavobacterium araucananum]